MQRNNSSSLCPEYEENYEQRLVSGAHFFVLYSLVAAVGVFGNVAIVTVVARRRVVIQRATFRFLTLLLSCYELAVATTLVLLLFRLGVGRHNRLNDAELVSPAWDTEDENAYTVRTFTLTRALFLLRDVLVGSEVNAYCLLAADRLLAIAAPLSRRWNILLVRCLAAASFAVTAGAEIGFQIWLMASLATADDLAACQLLVQYRSLNLVLKASLAVVYYAASLCCYSATAVLLLQRASNRVGGSAGGVCSGGRGVSSAAAAEQMKKPLAALVLGNLVQFLGLLPLVLDNFGLVQLEISVYYLFCLSCAAVPCITFAFNRSVRDSVSCCCSKRRTA